MQYGVHKSFLNYLVSWFLSIRSSVFGLLDQLGCFHFKFYFFQKPIDPGTLNKMYTRTGYLFLMEKKALGTTW